MSNKVWNKAKGILAASLFAMLLAACDQQAAPQAPSEDLEAQASSCRYVFVRGIYLDNTREFGTDPEVMLAAMVRDGGSGRKLDYDSVNDTGKWYSANTYIGCASRDALFQWYERDGSNLDVTVSVKGVSLGVKIDNGDDDMGEALIPLSDTRYWPITTDVGDVRFKHCAVPYLAQGSSGGAVTHLQNRLKARGFNPGTVDGKFGTQTYNAVVAFQKSVFSQPLEWDGKVGSQTWGKLGC